MKKFNLPRYFRDEDINGLEFVDTDRVDKSKAINFVGWLAALGGIMTVLVSEVMGDRAGKIVYWDKSKEDFQEINKALNNAWETTTSPKEESAE